MSITPGVLALAMDAFGGSVVGKTLLQKRMYFIAVILGDDYGHRAHYYGPYSDDVADSLVQLVQMGAVDEQAEVFGVDEDTGFARQRYAYCLTKKGHEAVSHLAEWEPGLANQVREAATHVLKASGRMDYKDLSIAAKVYLIFKQRDDIPSPDDIVSEAQRLSWAISTEQITGAIAFLKRLGVLQVAHMPTG